MYMDTHCHLDAPQFDSDLSEVLARSRKAGIGQWMIAGVGPEGWQRQRRLSGTYPGVHWSAGLHPWLAIERPFDETFTERLQSCLTGEHPAIAIGEIGIDRVRGDKETLGRQLAWFEALLKTAVQLDLPVILHVVGGHGHALSLMDRVGLPGSGGVVHSFSGSIEVAHEYLRRGLHLGLSTSALRRGGAKRMDLFHQLPLERVLLESDAPDQAAAGPLVRNEPSSVRSLAERVAVGRCLSAETVLDTSTANAIRLFGLD